MSLHWLDNADSWICPICGFETSSPAKYEGCKCPKCGFQNDKDKYKSRKPRKRSENRLEKAKEIIKANFSNGSLGLFNTRNGSYDLMTAIYEDYELAIDICYDCKYFKVFGLTAKEFSELEEYYENLKKVRKEELEYRHRK